MSTPLYSFRLKHLQMEIPYTNTTINIFSPWTYFLSFGSCLFYTVLILSIFPLFISKLSSKVKQSVEMIHYTLLFFYSFLIFSATLFYLIETKEMFNWSHFVCHPIPSWLRLLSITFTISKLWEWFDTEILLWKGHSLTKIGFLHLYHHGTTFLLFLFVMNFPGAEKGGMLLNGFVHTLMYYHFAFRLPKFVRPIITLFQILQLMTVTYIWHLTPSTCSNHQNYPRENPLEFLIPYALVPVYCLFFVKFFAEQYLFSSSKKVKSSVNKEE